MSMEKRKYESINPEFNPRKASTKLKEAYSNVEVMKRRFNVLKVQDEYNHYKTQDHEKRIRRHMQVHETIERERSELRKSLDVLEDTSQLKQQSQRLRQQLRFKINEARKNHRQERIEDYQERKEENAHNEEIIERYRKTLEMANQQRKHQIIEEEGKQKLNISRFKEEKIKDSLSQKSIEAGLILRRAEQKQKELNAMMAHEQELLRKNMESLQASQVMRSRFATVLVPHESDLPTLRARTNNSKHTTDSKATQNSLQKSMEIMII